MLPYGKLLRCRLCRRCSGPDNFKVWTNRPCVRRSRDPTAASTVPPRAPLKRHWARSDLVGPAPTCTAAKRARLLREQRADLVDRSLRDESALAAAWPRSFSTSYEEYMRVAVSAEAPPVPAHSSHILIACGGYGGCLACGSVTSERTSTLLEGVCHRYCTDPRYVRRLIAGKLPRAAKGRSALGWPDGSTNPVPRRWILEADPATIQPPRVDDDGDAIFVERPGEPSEDENASELDLDPDPWWTDVPLGQLPGSY